MNIGAPAEFLEALASLRDMQRLAGMQYREIPAPQHMAPYAAAITLAYTPNPKRGGRARRPELEPDSPPGSATVVILYDPEQAVDWGGPFRVVTHLRADIDVDMSQDPYFPELVWSELTDTLVRGAPDATNLVGTVTKELSQTFGGLQLRGTLLNVEVRCSWSADGPNLGDHARAVADFLALTTGQPANPLPFLEVVHD